MNDQPLAVAYGGGVNSTAMLVEFKRRNIYPDIILFADTGGERPETYKAVQLVSSWCQKNGLGGIFVVNKTFRKQPETLENDCLRKHMLPSIAYGYKSCSLKFKAEPQDKFCNNWETARLAWEKGLKVVKAIGYDAGEERRSGIKESDKYAYWYPLIEWNIYREDCVSICESEGLPTAKSSCFFCPSMKKHEIFELRDKHPDLLKRAINMEENAELTSIAGLGRSFAWKDLISADECQLKLFSDNAQPEIPCGCYDG